MLNGLSQLFLLLSIIAIYAMPMMLISWLPFLRKRSYTDTSNFTLRCGVCQIGVIGEKVIPQYLMLCYMLAMLLTHLSLFSFVLMILSTCFIYLFIYLFILCVCEHFRRQWSMHKQLVMLTSKSTDNALR